MVWDDLQHQMRHEEGLGMRERFDCYEDFLKAQLDIVTGYEPQGLRQLKRELISLLDAQEVTTQRFPRQAIAGSGAYSCVCPSLSLRLN